MDIVLTFGQTDSSAGTGIQADIKTVQALGGYAATVITAVAAQNTKGVDQILLLPEQMVRQQFKAIISDFTPAVIKTGMLGSHDIIEAVCDCIEELPMIDYRLVVDPIMVSRSGHSLLDKPARDSLKRRLLLRATVLTPNITEAEELTGLTIRDLDTLRHAAEMLLTLGPKTVILKGGSLESEAVHDVIAHDDGVETFEWPRHATRSTHGAGTTLSAGIAAGLAHGMAPLDAYLRARDYLSRAIATAVPLGSGHGPVNHAV